MYSTNTALEDFSCNHKQLTNLDVSKNTVLKHLNCKKLKPLTVTNENNIIGLDRIAKPQLVKMRRTRSA